MHIFKFIGGFRITVTGNKDIIKQKGLFIINTHVGYIDGLILGTLVPGSYTTKNEIKKTPFLGQAVAMGESIFIDRNKKKQIVHYINEVSARLKDNINIFNFPEGHASNGSHILPFFKAFFDAPLRVKALIVPITIDYTKVDGDPNYDRDGVYCADGKTSIIKHLWNLLSFKSIDIQVNIHNVIQPDAYPANARGRKELSDLCMQRMAAYKNLPIADHNPLNDHKTEDIAPTPVGKAV